VLSLHIFIPLHSVGLATSSLSIHEYSGMEACYNLTYQVVDPGSSKHLSLICVIEHLVELVLFVSP
jgi:hypothetical protein